MSGIGGQANSFAAHPRVVNQKAKFKDPYGLHQEEYVPSNIMFDKRVYRGSTNAAMVIPAGTYPDNLFQNQKQNNAQMKQQQRAQAAEEFFTRDIRTPEAPAGRQNIDIQTDQFVEELTDKAPCYEIAIQTLFWMDRPTTPRNIPIKTGVDKKTLVQDNELFIFDVDVEPILSVLCGKTLELARMEVLEEEELREMRSQQKQFTEIRNAELAEIQRMENAEIKKRQEFDKKKQSEKEKKKNRVFAHKKIVSRQIAKQYIRDAKSNTMRFLFDVGFFVDEFKTDVMEGDVLPWLEQQVISEVQKLEEYNKQPNEWIGSFIDDVHDEHKKTVQAEADRKLKVKQEKEAAELAKLEEKRKRRAAKEAKRKAEELQRLREEIKVNFIDKGSQQEGILTQDLININGNKDPNPVVGCLGGMLGQMIIVFNSIIKNFDKDNNIASHDVVQTYIHQYVLEKLKSEKMHVIVDRAAEKFLNGLEKPMQLNEMRVMKEPNYSKFREILRDNAVQGDPVLKVLINNLEELGISKAAFDLVFEGFWDLYCKKPQAADLNAKKLDGWINKIKLSVPTGSAAGGEDGDAEKEETELPLKAIVRVRIPLKRPEPEQNEEGEGEGDGEEEKDGEKVTSNKDNSVPPTPRNKDESKAEEILEEQELEDKVTKIATQGEQYQIYVMHQAAMRLLRQDLVKDMRRNIEALDSQDDNELVAIVDKDAIEVENKFLQLYTKKPAEDKQVPVFDFELF